MYKHYSIYMIYCNDNQCIIEKCFQNQTNFPKFPIEILQTILSYIGDWNYCYRKNEIIPMVYHCDQRYAILCEFLSFREKIYFFREWSSRSGESVRFGYNIPIKETLHLPTIHECRAMYDDGSIIKCLRYLQIQMTIYDHDTPKSSYTILSRITKYNSCYDSSDTDFDEDEGRSFEKIELK